MQSKTEPQTPARRPWLLIAAGAIGLLIALAGLLPPPAAAMPPRPPRPTAPPATVAPPQRTLIVLRLTLSPELLPSAWQTLWTGVQWQDGAGAWRDVAGWQGTLDEEARGVGKKTWVVAGGHLGHGPFRWLVYDRPGGEVRAASQPFHLPSAAGDICEVRIGSWGE